MPRFEREWNRVCEQRAADVIHQFTGWDVRVMSVSSPGYSPIDFQFLKDGKIVGIAEHKWRDVNRATFADGIWLSKDKYSSLTAAQITLDVPAYFVVSFKDVLAWINIDDVDTGKTTWADRKKPRAGGGIGVHDREQAYLVNPFMMTVLHKWNDNEEAAEEATWD